MRVSAAAAISARQMPASSGVQGPGESRIAEGLQRHRRLDVDLVVAADDGLGAELAEIVEEVVGEAVVVVDQQQHFRGLSTAFRWRRARPRAIHGPGGRTGSRGARCGIGGSRTESGEAMQRGTPASGAGFLTGIVLAALAAALALAWFYPPVPRRPRSTGSEVPPAPRRPAGAREPAHGAAGRRAARRRRRPRRRSRRRSPRRRRRPGRRRWCRRRSRRRTSFRTDVVRGPVRSQACRAVEVRGSAAVGVTPGSRPARPSPGDDAADRAGAAAQLPPRPPTKRPASRAAWTQRLGLVDALLELGLGVAVVDDAAAGLDVEGAVLHHRGAERDADVHVAAGGEVADAAAVDAALLGLELVDDLHRADLRARRRRCRRGGRRGGRRGRPGRRRARRRRSRRCA